MNFIDNNYDDNNDDNNNDDDGDDDGDDDNDDDDDEEMAFAGNALKPLFTILRATNWWAIKIERFVRWTFVCSRLSVV